MFERLKNLYDCKRLSLEGLRNAVVKGMITEAQFGAIAGIPYHTIDPNKITETEENENE